jgi:peroxiredoxin
MNQHGEQVSIKQLEGKFVMLNFVKADCQICLSQFQAINEIVEPVQSKWQVLTIVCGNDFEKVVRFANERNFDWPILKLDNDILLLEKYNIRTYPSYVLLNPDGTIAMATAPMPDELLDLYMSKLVIRYENIHSGRDR